MHIRRAPFFSLTTFRLFSGLLVVSLFSSCASTERVNIADELAKKRIEEARRTVVARVGDVEITKERVELYARYLAPKIVPHGNIRKERMGRIKEQALGEIVVKELKFLEAKATGVSVDEALIDSDLERMEKVAPPGKNLDDLLADQGRDRAWLREFLLKSRVVKKFMDQMNRKIAAEAAEKTGDEVVMEYYTANLERFREPDKIRVREILIKVRPGSSEEAWAESKAKAAWIIERAKAGDSFSSLAKEFSDDSYAEKGGDMGLVNQTRLMGELQTAVSGIKIGDIAGPVYSIYGHHVVKLIERKAGVQKPLASVREMITGYLLGQEKKRMFREWLSGLRNKNKVEYLYDFEKDKSKS